MSRAGSSRCFSALILAVAGLCRAAGAPVQHGEQWHIFEVGKRSFQQLERHAKINPRFLARSVPISLFGSRRDGPWRGALLAGTARQILSAWVKFPPLPRLLSPNRNQQYPFI